MRGGTLHPFPEPQSRPAQGQLGVDLELTRQVDHREEQIAHLRGQRVRIPGLGQLLLDLLGLFSHLGHDLVGMLPIETHRRRPLLQLLGQKRGGKGVGDIVKNALSSL